MTAGILVSPGDLYGPHGAGHVRIAVVQPLDRLALVASVLLRQPVIEPGRVARGRLAKVRHG